MIFFGWKNHYIFIDLLTHVLFLYFYWCIFYFLVFCIILILFQTFNWKNLLNAASQNKLILVSHLVIFNSEFFSSNIVGRIRDLHFIKTYRWLEIERMLWFNLQHLYLCSLNKSLEKYGDTVDKHCQYIHYCRSYIRVFWTCVDLSIDIISTFNILYYFSTHFEYSCLGNKCTIHISGVNMVGGQMRWILENLFNSCSPI